jgi:hypothetical protein
MVPMDLTLSQAVKYCIGVSVTTVSYGYAAAKGTASYGWSGTKWLGGTGWSATKWLGGAGWAATKGLAPHGWSATKGVGRGIKWCAPIVLKFAWDVTWGCTKMVASPIVSPIWNSNIVGKIKWIAAGALGLGVIGGAYTGLQYVNPVLSSTVYPLCSDYLFPWIGTGWKQAAVPMMEKAGDFIEPIATHVGGEVLQAAAEIGTNAQTSFWEMDRQAGEFLLNLTPGSVIQGIAGIGASLASGAINIAGHVAVGALKSPSWETWGWIAVFGAVSFGVAVGPKAISSYWEYLMLMAKEGVGKPLLNIEKKTQIPFVSPVVNMMGAVKDKLFPPIPPPKPLFEGELQRKLDNYVTATKNLVKNGGKLQNMVLEGPPGSGKTMVSKWITEQTGFNYVRISGGTLTALIDNHKRHVSELNKIMKGVKESRYPTILFIDECDAFCSDREKMDAEHKELLNEFLTATGDGSTKFAVIAATNRIADLDSAFLSRMDLQLHVGAPAKDTRTNIIRQYVNRAFGEPHAPKTQIERYTCLNDAAIETISKKTKHLGGRSLEKMVNQFVADKGTTKDNRLTAEMVDNIVYDYVWKDRSDPKAQRSWRVVEIARDFWHFKIGHITRVIKETLAWMVKTITGSVKAIKGYVWKPKEPQGLFARVRAMQEENQRARAAAAAAA